LGKFLPIVIFGIFFIIHYSDYEKNHLIIIQK
jgi:hypothetical protein